MRIVKMTHKGQITIPAEYRKKLNAEYFAIEIEDNKIIIKPVKSLAGSLQKYAKNKPIKEVMEEEKKAFVEGLIEKHKNS